MQPEEIKIKSELKHEETEIVQTVKEQLSSL
jgi:hypothetical protein